MNKTLKFRPHFIQHILAKSNGITTRLFDEKNIAAGDTVDFLASDTGKKFATAKVTKTYERPFDQVAQEGRSPTGLYEQYRNYYQRLIEPTTPMKFIYFDIVQNQ